MILDTLLQIDRYAGLHASFPRAFDFLRRLGTTPTLGRHDIDGDSVCALVQRYETRAVTPMQLEAHRRFIDIQYLVAGCETIVWAPLAGLAVAVPYDDTKDAALFQSSADAIPVPIRGGQCAILFPDDAHAPCRPWGDPAEVVKVVVKVAVGRGA